MARSLAHGERGLGQEEGLEGGLALAFAVLLDARLDFVAQAEAVERQHAHVGDAALRHEAANDLAQELGRLAERDVLVVNLLVEPGDQSFKRPVAACRRGP